MLRSRPPSAVAQASASPVEVEIAHPAVLRDQSYDGRFVDEGDVVTLIDQGMQMPHEAAADDDDVDLAVPAAQASAVLVP